MSVGSEFCDEACDSHMPLLCAKACVTRFFYQKAILEFNPDKANSLLSEILFIKQLVDYFVHHYQSYPFDACNCTCNTRTCTTSLMCVKKAHFFFVYKTYCLGHWNEENESIKHQIE